MAVHSLFFGLYVNGALPEACQMVIFLAPALFTNRQNLSHTTAAVLAVQAQSVIPIWRQI